MFWSSSAPGGDVRAAFGLAAGGGAVLCLALAGCGESGDGVSPAGSVDTLVTGTVVVRNPAGAGDEAGTNTNTPPTLTPDLRLGTASGDGPELFGRAHDLDVDELGRIYVLDSQAAEIRVFGRDGAHVRTVGGKGAGPGELDGPTGIEWAPGARLWVEDQGNGRYSVYDSAGSLVTTHPRNVAWRSFGWDGFFDDEGSLYVRRMVFGSDGADEWLAQLDSSMALRDSFPLPEHEPLAYELVRDGRVRSAVTVPFSPRMEWEIARDGTLWFGTSDAYRFYQRSLAGDTLRIVEKAYEPVPATAAERDEALSQEFYQRMADQGADVDPGRIPEFRPAWRSFTVDREGGLWVVVETADDTGSVIDRFDADGHFRERFELPARIRTYPGLVVRGDFVYAITQDDLSVNYVLRAPYPSSNASSPSA